MTREFLILWFGVVFYVTLALIATAFVVAAIIQLFGEWSPLVFFIFLSVVGISYMIATVLYDVRSR